MRSCVSVVDLQLGRMMEAAELAAHASVWIPSEPLNFGERLMYLWKPIICLHQLDVQETKRQYHSSGESEIISLDAGLRIDGPVALDLWDMVIEELRSTNNKERPIRLAPGHWCGTGHSSNKTKSNPTPNKRETEMLINCRMWTMLPQTHILLKVSLSCTYCYVGNTAKQCNLGLFQDSDLAGDLEDSKSTSGGTLCVFGSHTFFPISWMCKKQTSVSHISTESDIISLDAGLRMDGITHLISGI